MLFAREGLLAAAAAPVLVIALGVHEDFSIAMLGSCSGAALKAETLTKEAALSLANLATALHALLHEAES